MENRPDFLEPLWSQGNFLTDKISALPELNSRDSAKETAEVVNALNSHESHTAFQEQKLTKADAHFKELTYNYLKLKDLLTDMEERIVSKESVITDLRAALDSTKDRYREMEKRALEAEAKVLTLSTSLSKYTNPTISPPITKTEQPPVSSFPSDPFNHEAFGQDSPIASEPSHPSTTHNLTSVPTMDRHIHNSQRSNLPTSNHPMTTPQENHTRHLLNTNSSRSHWGKIELHNLPKFDGSNKLVSEWVAEVELLGCMFNIPKEDMVMALQIMLTGPAKDWLLAEAKHIMAIHGHNWMAWKEAIKDRFYDEDKRNAVIIEYQTLNFKHFKSIKAYMARKFFLRSKAYGDEIPADQSESNLVAQTLLLFPSTARMALRASWIDKCLTSGLDIRSSSMSWTQLSRAVDDLLSSTAAAQQYDPCILAENMSQRNKPVNSQTDKKPEPFNTRCRNCGLIL